MKKKYHFFAIALCFIFLQVSSYTLAKYTFEQEYPMRLQFVQAPIHYEFSSKGESYILEISQSGLYAFQLWGADGGSASRVSAQKDVEVFKNGGSGGVVKATRYFEAGDILLITVGRHGKSMQGGFNGGGNSGSSIDSLSNWTYYGGGGGGATDVRLNGNGLEDRILVAGGGGGAGIMSSPDEGYNVGNGGNGGESMATGPGGNGTGDGSGAGAVEEGGTGHNSGGLGIGGNGLGSAGGGGAGYYGGGGAFGYGGGGGGSSQIIIEFDRWRVPEGMPEREPNDATSDTPRDGYAIISYIGEAEDNIW